nr:hypothetical protein [Planctomycetota bacterium]
QPHCLAAEADLLLCQGIAADRRGRKAEAAKRYRAYVALPRFRRGLTYDPVPEVFAAWRARVMAGAD